MQGLAHLLQARGKTIIGVDQNPVGDAQVKEQAAGGQVAAADLVIHSDALPNGHPLLKGARAAGVGVLKYHEALGELSRESRTLAVTGTHGKSTTTSMLAHIFWAAGLDPSALVGAASPAWGGAHARVGRGDYFIVEADDYRNHYLSLRAESAIITTIDLDHPDFFATLEDVEKSFAAFVKALPLSGVLVVPALVRKNFEHITWPRQTKAVDEPASPIDICLPGAHMQYNAWLAIQLAQHYGIAEHVARAALRQWPGLSRRFERLGVWEGVEVISDYGHHPHEISATIKGARERYPKRRIGIFFEAHTAERLTQYFDDFVLSLSLGDGVILAPVFMPAGRNTLKDEAAQIKTRLAKSLGRAQVTVLEAPNLADIGQVLAAARDKFDVIIAFSAGQLDAHLRAFVNAD